MSIFQLKKINQDKSEQLGISKQILDFLIKKF